MHIQYHLAVLFANSEPETNGIKSRTNIQLMKDSGAVLEKSIQQTFKLTYCCFKKTTLDMSISLE